jgi:D-beta-D-heptose 7-phosphate kinase/D-beta-D-heptose 1-phosphate adenosyltransferase
MQAMPTSPQSLIALVEKFARPRIMLVGDVMVDEYIYGDAERLSPEAPVPVVQERYREQRAGGAGNVAAALATLGAQVLAVSICGDDAQGRLLMDLFHKMPGGGVVTAGILQVRDRPTTSKIRVVGLAQHRHPQQMLRLDQETTAPLTAPQESELLAYIEKELPTCEALALEDYNKGLLAPAFCRRIIGIARQLKKPVLVDPALISDYSKYDGASTITPNRFEAEKAANLKLSDSPEDAARLAESLLEKHHLETCLLTLDRQGMYLLESAPSQAPHGNAEGGMPPKAAPERALVGTLIPTRPRNVYDVTGAGDMVLAMLTMAIASGASWIQAAHLANTAGGLEVEKFGIVPVTRDEIIDELQRQDSAAGSKEKTLPELLKELQRRRNPASGALPAASSPKIVFTNGVFDILHAGHVRYLDFSKKQGDVLIVAVNSDDSVRRLKGPTRPVNPLADRLAVLAGLQSVDYVISFDQDTPLDLITALQPDILIKGEDYAGREVVGREIVEARGGKVILAPLLQGRSTTSTIERAKK